MDRRFLILFLLLAALFWNPVSFAWFYADQPASDSRILRFLFLAIPAVILAAVAFLWKRDAGNRWFDAMLGFSFMLIVVGAAISVNAILGRFLPGSGTGGKNAGLIFAPYTKALYEGPEFRFTAATNGIGLRDGEVDTTREDRFRILCFGDSWTFGWGVEIEDSWPKVLQRILLDSGRTNVEVINCGQPGQYPTTYLKNMEAVLPVLKPDLVLLGVNQLDDLAQMYEAGSGRKPEPGLLEGLWTVGRNFVRSSFGNYIRLIAKEGGSAELKMREVWRKEAERKLKSLDKAETLRYRMLNDTLRTRWLSGDLNPGLMLYYLDFPDRSFVFNDPGHPATREAVSTMGEDLKRMKDLCSRHSAPLVFINMPTNEFTGHRVSRMPTDHLNKLLEENNRIDSIYRAAAEASGMEYMEMTGRFKALEPKDSFFFRYDGHPNRRGYREIAEHVSGEVLRRGLVR